MDKFDRIFQLHAILNGRRTPIPIEDLMARLGCSKATLYRAINTLKDRLHAPVEPDANVGGFKYRHDSNEAYQLPGLWFTPSELQALAVLQRLLANLGPGLLEDHLAPLTKRIDELVARKKLNLTEAAKRLRMPGVAARNVGPAFQIVVSATLQRRKLWMQYHSRTRDEHTERVVSPQRVIHYRETWYLDAWDEKRDELRTFSIDRIRTPRVMDDRAVDVPEDQLDQHFTTGYGIFGGKANKTAVLRFTPERARWVADEQWHPQQEGRFLDDGQYELHIPYRESRELVMDILRHGGNVEVVEPQELRDEVKREMVSALRRYNE